MNGDMYSLFRRRDAGRLSEFMERNSETGKLKVQASLAGGTIPVEGVKIVIYKDFEDGRWVFFDGQTDSSGIVDNITLPAPPYKEPTIENVAGPHATYTMRAEKSGFTPMVRPVNIYSGLRTLQPVDFITQEGGR